MVDVREVIAEAIPCNIVYGRPQAADGIISALTSTGFRILGPDEIDGPTGWQPIETAPTPPARFRVNGLCADHDKLTWFVEGEPTHWMPFPAEPTAIRALKEKRT